MTAHELARKLLEGPDMEVYREDWEFGLQQVESCKVDEDVRWRGPRLVTECVVID